MKHNLCQRSMYGLFVVPLITLFMNDGYCFDKIGDKEQPVQRPVGIVHGSSYFSHAGKTSVAKPTAKRSDINVFAKMCHVMTENFQTVFKL